MRGKCDEASTHVLEAVIVASIMVSAVAFVVTFQTDGTTSAYESISKALEIQTRDFVNNRFNWPLQRALCVGETKGEQWLLDAATQRRSSFRDQVNDSYAPGIDANLLLKNGYGEMWLHKEFDNPAIAGHAITYEPNWSGTYVVPVLGVASGAEQIEINSAAIVKGELAMQKGEGIEIVVAFEGGKQERLYASTALIGEVWQYREFAQNLTLVSPVTGERTMTLSLEPKHVSPTLKEAKSLAFMLSPGPQGGSNTSAVIPTNTTLTVRFPPQWSSLGFARTSPAWVTGTSGNSSSGIVATFVLKDASAMNETIRVDAFAPTLPAQAFDLITAELSNGSLSRSEFVVQYPAGVDKGLPITIHPSIPYPLRAGSSAVLGVAIANGGPNATIRQVDYIIPGGFDMHHNDGQGSKLFAEGGEPQSVNGTGVGGTWKRVDPRHIQWKGNMIVNAAKAADLLVSVNITNDLNQATAIESVWTPRVLTELTYNNSFTTTSSGWGSTPGFVRSIVKPDSAATEDADGYPHVALTGNESITYPVSAKLKLPNGMLTGSTSYTVVPGTSDLSRMQNAMGNASTHVSKRIAPLGSLVTVDHDISSLLTTLADQGASKITIQTDLYTPAGQGCGPTMTWARNASTLPLARIRAMSLYDETGLGAPGVFLAAEDKSAYKVGTLGTTAWNKPHETETTTIATGTMPLAGPSVFTGTAGGRVARLDPVFAGTTDWSVAQAASADVTASRAIRGLIPNATRGELLSWSDQVLQLRDAATGSSRAVMDTGAITEKVLQVSWDAEGSILLLTSTALYRLNTTLATVQSYAIADAVGFAITPTSIVLAHANLVTVHDPVSLAQVGSPVSLGADALLTAAGDATGDNIPDLVIALDTLTVKVVSGATGTVVATYSVALPDLAHAGLVVPTMGSVRQVEDESVALDSQEATTTSECRPVNILSAYSAGQACVDVNDPNNSIPLPLQLLAQEGRILYAYRVGSVAKSVAWKSDGALALEIQHAPNVMPTSAALGAWTPGVRVFALATSDGELTLYDDATGAPLWIASPTTSTGTFAFTLRVPMGGFFGTNILLTRIRWEDPLFGQQEVVLPEWFQVVAPDGKPVLSPYYTVAAIMQVADIPMVPLPP